MSKRYFFDTSALVKLYRQEKGTDALDDVMSREQPVLVISDLSVIEIISAFAKKVRSREINDKIFNKAVSAFEKDITLFEVIEVDSTVKSGAISLLKKLATKQGLRTLDAIQLSAVMTAHGKKPIDLFVLADRLLADVAKAEGLNVLCV
ncbi:MAG: type II toxin-antitoxin system VapC family toxin [Geobacter sp.]|nr:type II toxin-antitoxin system VapC family toxin [Geobacter sp.]